MAVPARFPVHVTGDNRYKLYVNEQLVSMGPVKGDATIRTLDQDYDVVMWEKHGVFAVDVDIMSALIYIAAKNMGFEPDGMTDAQLKEMSFAFGLPK